MVMSVLSVTSRNGAKIKIGNQDFLSNNSVALHYCVEQLNEM